MIIILTGAENGIRTRDPQLGKLMLYQLSYFREVGVGVGVSVGVRGKGKKIIIGNVPYTFFFNKNSQGSRSLNSTHRLVLLRISFCSMG